jgi:hypothetical protein
VVPSEFAKLRATAPVSRVQLWDGSSVWLLTRHADAVMVLDDPRFSKNRSLAGFPELSAGGKLAAKSLKHPTFVDMDPVRTSEREGSKGTHAWLSKGTAQRTRSYCRGCFLTMPRLNLVHVVLLHPA